MSDVQTSATIASLRAEVERLKAELQGEREDVAACRAEVNRLSNYAERLLAENVRLTNEEATERSRAGVLEAEVRAYREWQRTKCDDNASSLDHWHACKALDAATLETDRTNAIDAAKFGGA